MHAGVIKINNSIYQILWRCVIQVQSKVSFLLITNKKTIFFFLNFLYKQHLKKQSAANMKIKKKQKVRETNHKNYIKNKRFFGRNFIYIQLCK